MGERRGTAPFVVNLGAKTGVTVKHHAPIALRQGKNPGNHCRGGWVGPIAGLIDLEKEKKKSFSCRYSNPGPSGA